MITSSPTATALRGLESAIAPPRPGVTPGNWRWTLHTRLIELREALIADDTGDHGSDGWLSARNAVVFREHGALLTRIAGLIPDVLDHPDLEELRREMRRLLLDAGHHVQRLHDLAYDEVELELGGEQ